MDAQKSAEMQPMPEPVETPAVEGEMQEGFEEMEELPMMDEDMNTMPIQDMAEDQALPFTNMEGWHFPIITPQSVDYDVPVTEEQQMTDIPQMEMGDVQNMDIEQPDAMRGYYRSYADYGYSSYNYRDYDNEGDILEKIIRYNPGIFRRFAYYGIPFPAARNIVKRIIRLTLDYK
jgi:hypothetical protein